MRLAAITTSLLAAACSLQSEELTTTSIECTTNEDGSTTCSENEDRPDGDEGDPGDGADLVCSGTGCVSQCEYSDDSFYCSITCENGLTCQSSCREGTCEVSCDCPDGGGGGGCEGEPTDECCQEHPDDPACQPPCPDGTENCSCEDNPEDPDCRPTCEDGSTEWECYCQENPDDPECAPPCPEDSTDEECVYCREHPDDPNCAP
jgi:hypothetical protein